MPASLTLDTPQPVTLELTVLEVTFPIGTKSFKATCDERMFFERSNGADGAPAMPSVQFPYDPGTFCDVLPGMEGGLTANTVYRFVGSIASQSVTLWALSET